MGWQLVNNALSACFHNNNSDNTGGLPYIMKKLLKLPLKIIAFPLIAVLLALQFLASIFVGLTSIATNLLASIFLLGSVAGWIADAPNCIVCQAIALGVFFAFAPHIASWLLEKVTDLALVILNFLLS